MVRLSRPDGKSLACEERCGKHVGKTIPGRHCFAADFVYICTFIQANVTRHP